MFLEFFIFYLWGWVGILIPSPDPLTTYLLAYNSAHLAKYPGGPLYTIWYYGIVNTIMTIFFNLGRLDPRGNWEWLLGLVS